MDAALETAGPPYTRPSERDDMLGCDLVTEDCGRALNYDFMRCLGRE